MSMERMLRQRARIERAAPAVAADGTVSEDWQQVAVATPCLLEKLSAGDGVASVARCYFGPCDGLLTPGTVGRNLRVQIDGVKYFVREIYRMGGAGGNRQGLLVADLES